MAALPTHYLYIAIHILVTCHTGVLTRNLYTEKCTLYIFHWRFTSLDVRHFHLTVNLYSKQHGRLVVCVYYTLLWSLDSLAHVHCMCVYVQGQMSGEGVCLFCIHVCVCVCVLCIR